MHAVEMSDKGLQDEALCMCAVQSNSFKKIVISTVIHTRLIKLTKLSRNNSNMQKNILLKMFERFL